MSSVQPKTVQKLALRFAFGLLSIAALLMGYNFFRTYGKDINNLGTANTQGWIAAVEDTSNGSRMVVIKGDGTVTPSPGYIEGANDRDFAWRPDGNQIIFTSDRKDQTFNLFRWNLANGSCEARTVGTRNFANPFFAPSAADDALKTALVTSGGFVAEFDPVEMATMQVLPPTGREVAVGAEEGSGGTGQFDAVYSKIGTSFKEARWTADKSRIVAIMRRDTGEVLISQSLEPVNGRFPPPTVIAAGEALQFDVSPVGSMVAYTVMKFEFPDPSRIPPDFIKNGRVIMPFRHLMAIVNLDKPDDPDTNGVLAPSPDDKVAFANPKFSPDGTSFLASVGPFDGGGVDTKQVVNVPATVQGAQGGSVIIKGKAQGMAWSPDGKTVVFVRSEGGKRSLFTIGVDGGGEKRVAEGDYARPAFSPQQKL